MEIRYIDPLMEFGPLLMEVEKPARYIGGEYGTIAGREGDFRTLIAFPDLYEIGMSNQALKILYNRLNGLAGVSCDRAFAPAPDFEALLRKKGIPLYGLDTGIVLGDLDLLCFTLGYELGITGILTILDTAHIPLHTQERTGRDPIIIMGGPCVSNPRPYEGFIDAFWIGEAEAGFFELVQTMADMKKAGEGRGELLSLLVSHPNVWTQGKKKASRAIDRDFIFSTGSSAVFPVPSMKIVQHHGSVEIMRGCPNGCRFCHAGYWYRPMRQKNADLVREEIDALVNQGGYREISLSSLSTGDYHYINELVETLNQTYVPRHISFQLPSLRVSSFSLPLLEKVSEIRKSGLTFAVETPVEAWQLSINKAVYQDDIVLILREAKKNGWRGVKFYFMIGLPVGSQGEEYKNNHEEKEIVDFILNIAARTGMVFHVNVGTFIPKPHTPYQGVPQIDEQTAWEKLIFIRNSLKPRGHKVGLHDPFVSVIEGLIARGDERVGDLVEEAFRSGCRLDAWTENIKKEVWLLILEKYRPLIEEILRGAKNKDQEFPWSCIDSEIRTGYILNEFKKSQSQEITLPCIENCTHHCGICDRDTIIVRNNIQHDNLLYDKTKKITPINLEQPEGDTYRILFSFSKTGKALFLPHLGVMEMFSMAFIRAKIPVFFSKGFNPLPRLDFASPLAMGIEGENEIAALDTVGYFDAGIFKTALDSQLPQGFRINTAITITIPWGIKKHSLASLLWGYGYENSQNKIDLIKAQDEKAYRLSRGGLFGLKRKLILAKNLSFPEQGGLYFDIYRELYSSL
jgi:radical SAM superfamily enzyme YgiQ (UPF0313 family)